MKKQFALILTIMLLISFLGCSSLSDSTSSGNTIQTQASTVSTISQYTTLESTSITTTTSPILTTFKTTPVPTTVKPTPIPTTIKPTPIPTVKPINIIVYVTKTGTKYHTSSCSYLRQSKIAISLSQAKLSYTPCSRCNPPR